MLTGFFLAWRFLTILPGGRENPDPPPRDLGRSTAYYPLVGLFLGMLLWGAFWLLAQAFPRPLCDGLVILLLVLLTGAFHLDGLADSLDGLAAGKTPAERLQIMRDHRVGAFGAVGLILILGIKFLALNSLPGEVLGKALLVSPALSRWSMVQLIYRSPCARPEGGLGKIFKENVRKREMAAATALSLAAAISLFRFWGAVLWLMIGVSALGVQALFTRRIGGITGDVLGAANEIHEVLALLILSGIYHRFY